VTEHAVAATGATLSVTYTAPRRTSARRDAMVVLHGASEGTRSFELYERLHRVLPPIGVGVATFDRRGEGTSDGEPSVGRFDVQVADARAVAASLDADRVGALGFSQGAWCASLLAAAEPRTTFVVTIAACGVTPYEQMRYGVARHLRDAGWDQAVVDQALALREGVARAMRGTLGDEAPLAVMLAAAAHEPWWPLACLRTTLAHGPDRAAWVAEMDYDPLPAMRSVRCPVLALYGAADEWTPVEPSVAAWADAQGADATVEVLDGADHALNIAGGGADPRYEPLLVAWLTATLARSPS
jgi:pimeloyl-ACP methyl ester carboxylesterase